MMDLLVRKGLWNATGPEVEDKNTTDSSKSDTALALIPVALGEDEMAHVEGFKTVRDAWKTLK